MSAMPYLWTALSKRSVCSRQLADEDNVECHIATQIAEKDVSLRGEVLRTCKALVEANITTQYKAKFVHQYARQTCGSLRRLASHVNTPGKHLCCNARSNTIVNLPELLLKAWREYLVWVLGQEVRKVVYEAS